MRGSLRKLGERRWRPGVYLGVDPTTGKKRQLGRVYRRSKAGAEDALRELLSELRAGEHAPVAADPDDRTVAESIEG